MPTSQLSTETQSHQSSSSSPRGMQHFTPARVTKRRAKAAKTAQHGPASSPLAPVSQVLTPDRPRERCASFEVRLRRETSSPDVNSVFPRAQTDEEETPSKKQTIRNRPILLEPRGTAVTTQFQQNEGNLADHDIFGDGVGTRPHLMGAHTSPDMYDTKERVDNRPVLPERGASEPAISCRDRLAGPQIDRDIELLIKAGPGSGPSSVGFVYAFVTRPKGCDLRLLKFGTTKGHPTKRSKAIKHACKHPEIIEHRLAIARQVPHYKLAERLIHKELLNFRHPWPCACEKKHREYYHVTDEVALEVFDRWRSFCEKEPWDNEGILLPEWEHRLRHRVRYNDPRRDFDHRELARHWRVFAFPKPFERVANDLRRLWNHVFPSRWYIAAVAEVLTMGFVWPFSPWTIFWAKTIFCLFLLELICMEGMYTTEMLSRHLNGGLQRFFLWQLPVPYRSATNLTEKPQVWTSDTETQFQAREDSGTETFDEENEEIEDEDVDERDSPPSSPEVTYLFEKPKDSQRDSSIEDDAIQDRAFDTSEVIVIDSD